MNENNKYPSSTGQQDEYWMQYALEEAEIAFEKDEIPVGAVIIYKEKIIARAHNSTKLKNNSLAHAEKLVIETAQRKIGKWLYDCTLYVTLEPCAMCSGIIILSRLGSVIFGAYDEKSGTCGSLYNLLDDSRFNHNPKLRGGVLAEESKKLLQKFFQRKRK